VYFGSRSKWRLHAKSFFLDRRKKAAARSFSGAVAASTKQFVQIRVEKFGKVLGVKFYAAVCNKAPSGNAIRALRSFGPSSARWWFAGKLAHELIDELEFLPVLSNLCTVVANRD